MNAQLKFWVCWTIYPGTGRVNRVWSTEEPPFTVDEQGFEVPDYPLNMGGDYRGFETTEAAKKFEAELVERSAWEVHEYFHGGRYRDDRCEYCLGERSKVKESPDW